LKVIRKEGMEKLDRKEYSVLKALDDEIEGGRIGIFYTTTPAGRKVAMHFHPKAKEILIFLCQGEVKVNGDILNLNPGDIVLLSPREKHEIYGPSRLIAIKIPNLEGDKVIC